MDSERWWHRETGKEERVARAPRTQSGGRSEKGLRGKIQGEACPLGPILGPVSAQGTTFSCNCSRQLTEGFWGTR